VGRAQLSPNPAQPNDRSRAPRLGQLQGDQRVAHAASDAGRERAGKGVADRAHRFEERADVIDRAQHRISPDEIHQPSHVSEDSRQQKDGLVQILDQEVQPGKGVPEQQVFHALADLVSVQEDVLWGSHTPVDE